MSAAHQPERGVLEIDPTHARQKTSPKVIFLTGAPLRHQLDWHEDHLVEGPHLSHHAAPATPTSSNKSTASVLPRWRSVCPYQLNAQDDLDEETKFLSTATFDHAGLLHNVDTDFPDYLLALPEDTMVYGTIGSTGDTIEATLQSFYSALSGVEQHDVLHGTGQTINTSLAITDLRSIPNAARLHGIPPQDRLVNLLVGVISAQPVRSVQLRQRNAQMDLVEVLVGDETRSGFGVTFWLAPENHRRLQPDTLRSSVVTLRSGDFVLFSNIALSAYRGLVRGQSLGRRPTWSGTQVFRVDHGHDHPGLDHKIKRLREWAERFLGSNDHTRARLQVRGYTDELPPNTPDD